MNNAQCVYTQCVNPDWRHMQPQPLEWTPPFIPWGFRDDSLGVIQIILIRVGVYCQNNSAFQLAVLSQVPDQLSNRHEAGIVIDTTIRHAEDILCFINLLSDCIEPVLSYL